MFCFLFFLKSFLPFFSFFNKYNDYITLYLLKELSSECVPLSIIYRTFLLLFKDYVLSISSIYIKYNVLINDNFIFFGFYGINEEKIF